VGAPLEREPRSAHLDVDRGSVLPDVDRTRPKAPFLLDRPAEVGEPVKVVGMNDRARRKADQLPFVVSVHPVCVRVRLDDFPIEVEDEQGIGCRLEDAPVAFPALFEGELGELPVGYVNPGADRPRDITGIIAQ